MATAKKKDTQDARRDACMSASNAAQFARAFGKDGKYVRGVLRSKLGVYVSKGDAFDDAIKTRLYDTLTARESARTATQDADASK
jgi:hypothetical protein